MKEEVQQKFVCECGKSFESQATLRHHKTRCKVFQANKKQREIEEREARRLPNGLFKCDNPDCTNEHDGSYGSGRFCSEHCRRVYTGIKSNMTMKKNGTKRCNFNSHSNVEHKRAPYGSWRCERCNLIFETRAQLFEHNHQVHPIEKGSSWNKGLTKETDERIAKYCQTIKELIDSGIIQHPMKGKHLSEEHKKKTSDSMIQYRKTLNADTYRGFIPNYNVDSIPVLESIAKEHGWHIQHAEHKGEFYVLGYFVDAYDKDNNIVIEYDEPHHYIDAENNVLCEDDIARQKEIIEYLHCEFWRYNEKTKCLWKVVF